MDIAGPGPHTDFDVVGRDAELALIDRFAGSTDAGLRALTIRGEPGIGKTTLWRHAIGRFTHHGLRVLTARPTEEEMPLEGVTLGDLFIGVHGTGPAGEHEVLAKGRVVVDSVRALSQDRPTVLAIDDAQWLDQVSARSLRFALRRLTDVPVVILATFRTDIQVDDPLALDDTVPPERREEIHLGPMHMDAIRAVLGNTVRAVSKPTLRMITEVSGGNPGYAVELARFRTAPGSALEPAERPLPGSLQEAVVQRLDDAPQELTPVLELVATLGRATPVDLAASLDVVEPAELDRLIERAERSDLLVVEPGPTIGFAHPLIRSAVYGRMGPVSRRALHERLARGTGDDDERARHLALSTDEPDAEVADLLEAASVRATARGALDLAAEFARHARRVTPEDRPQDAHRRALSQIVNLTSAGEVSRARNLLDELVAGLPAGRDRAEILLERVFVEDDDPTSNEAVLRQALEEAGEDEVLRAQVLDVLGWRLAQYRGDLEAGLRCAREAVAIADRRGDPELQMLTWTSLAVIESLSGRPQPDRLQRAVEITEQIDAPPQWAGPRVWLGKQELWEGDLASSERRFRELHEETLTRGTEFRRPFALFDLSLVACARGEIDRAERYAVEGIEGARDAEDSFTEWWLQYPLALAAAWRGDAARARDAADRLLLRATERGERPTIVRAKGVLGLLALSEGDVARAAPELSDAAELLAAMGVEHPGAFGVLPDAVEAAVRIGDVDAATDLSALLERQARTTGPWATAASARARGWVSMGRGEAGATVDAFTEAANEFERLGFRPDAARSLLGAGSALLRAGQPSAALDALTDARDRFAGFGAELWERRTEEQMERAAPGHSRGELTRTERRVAALVAQGMRNREIAASLFMSVPTVEAHLTRTYRKLGIRSRTELARLVTAGDVDVSLADAS